MSAGRGRGASAALRPTNESLSRLQRRRRNPLCGRRHDGHRAGGRAAARRRRRRRRLQLRVHHDSVSGSGSGASRAPLLSYGALPRRNEPYGNGRGGLEALLAEPALASDWESIEPEPAKAVRTMFAPDDKPKRGADGGAGGGRRPRRPEPVEDDSAVKKFGSAKAISSAQFFGEQVPRATSSRGLRPCSAARAFQRTRCVSQDNKFERDANLSRFAGSSSISSAEYFGERGERGAPGFTVSAPDLDDVRESVRMGVTRVAGRLSSLANGVVSSLQERYGY